MQMVTAAAVLQSAGQNNVFLHIFYYSEQINAWILMGIFETPSNGHGHIASRYAIASLIEH